MASVSRWCSSSTDTAGGRRPIPAVAGCGCYRSWPCGMFEGGEPSGVLLDHRLLGFDDAVELVDLVLQLLEDQRQIQHRGLTAAGAVWVAAGLGWCWGMRVLL